MSGLARWLRLGSTVVATGLVVAVGYFDLERPSDPSVIAMLIVVPMIASLGSPHSRRHLWLGALALAVVAATTSVDWNTRPRIDDSTLLVASGVAYAGIAAGTLLSWRIARSLEGHDRTLADLHAVVDTVQDVVLPEPPHQVGPLRTEARYLAATAEARVGSDLYAVLDGPDGTRLIIGDVMGRGLEAVQTASEVLRGFRESAHDQAPLDRTALGLDTIVARRHGGAGFVTALLATIPHDRGTVDLVCLGHPPPLLLRGGRATVLDLGTPRPPLGLLDLGPGPCPSTVLPFRAGDALLFYTDGLTDARDPGGRPYPLEERASALRVEDPGAFLDALRSDVLGHTARPPQRARRWTIRSAPAVAHLLRDDAALLLVQG